MIDAIDRWENDGGAVELKRPREITPEKVADSPPQPAAGTGFETAAKGFTSAGDVTVQAQDPRGHELVTSATDTPGARSV